MDIRIEGNRGSYLYRAAPARRFLVLSVLVALYAVVLPYCYLTAGEPRKAAAISAQELADKRWAAEAARLSGNLTEQLGSEIPVASAGAPALTFPVGQVDTDVFEVAEEEEELVSPHVVSLASNSTTKSSLSNSWLASWLGPSKEQKRAKKDFEDWQRQFNERSEEPLSLPPTYLPSAWACLALFSILTMHALFLLLCHWIVGFKAMVYYSPARKVEEGCFLLVLPPENRGKAEMVVVKRSGPGGGGVGTLQIEFQRQTYEYTPKEKIQPAEKQEHFPGGVFTLSRCPTADPLLRYLQATGLRPADVERLTEKWGKNHLAVHSPGFLELLQAQLLSPLAMFQVFCAMLWLLDEYWSYTLWTLVSVIVFEATTVFHRTRTQNMLGGMAPRPSPVYALRGGQWVLLTTRDLLPGDIISLGFKRSAAAPQVLQNSQVLQSQAQNGITSTDEAVPCDCVLLRGSAVVNEASLTGESVPQMKESLTAGVGSERDGKGDENTTAPSPSASMAMHLDMMGAHRVSVLFSGTTLLTVDAEAGAGSAMPHVAPAPDRGAVAFVVRTGFSSSQGALMQMIEFSQQTVTGNAREIGLALLVLLMFALAAAGYVLREGLRKKEKTTHELLLKCVIIITSVVPRQFPMQTAVAVNMALMALVKAGIFCTEQFRVPLAGKVTHCLFDKTGTLTTDQLVPVGLVNSGGFSPSETSSEGPELNQVVEATPHAALVLAACHSLVAVDVLAAEGVGGGIADPKTPTNSSGEIEATLAGDPIELASLHGVQWHWDAASSTARPGSFAPLIRNLDVLRRKTEEIRSMPPSQRAPDFATVLDALERQVSASEARLAAAKELALHCPFRSVRIAMRHHFSSQLQRMSVVAEVEVGAQRVWFSLVKGSPEALLPLFAPGKVPSWYQACYEKLARRGLRVLALGFRQIEDSMSGRAATEKGREWAEEGLSFCGFIAFQCKIRTDSHIVVRSLRESDHRVIMLTGDALLTSLHVACEVGICDKALPSLTLLAGNVQGGEGKRDAEIRARWVRRSPDGTTTELPFCLADVETLAKSADLLTTETDFVAVDSSLDGSGSVKNKIVSSDKDQESGPPTGLWAHCGAFKVFARMSPQGKARVIRAIQQSAPDQHVLMCGDGGNDVGALKQADIGIALLAGHANSNTTETLADKVMSVTDGHDEHGSRQQRMSAEDALNAHDAILKKRIEEVNALRIAHMKEFQARYQRESQAALQLRVKELTERGEYMKTFSLMKDQAVSMKNAIAAENERFMRAHGHVWDPIKGDDTSGDSGTAGGLASLLAGIDTGDAQGGAGGNSAPVVRPGDASVAAPFTSRVPSVRAVVDLIRQGRCTLLSALMHQQIMMLESIIAAYTLSALSLHNARSSERQMMASSWLIMTAAVAFSYSSPLDHMHPERPIRSLFHPAIFVSMLGQAAIHIACMTLAVQWATDAMGPEKLREVTDFFKKAKAKEIDAASLCGEDDLMCQMNAFWAAPFLPNLLNTTVFLVETSQMISVFFANYKGRPWMKGMMENHALFLSVFACIGGVVVASWEMVPKLNEIIQLAPFPDDGYRYKVVALVSATIAGTFLWDRLCLLVFAPRAFSAIVDEARRTTLLDLLPVLGTLAKVVVVVWVLATGNLLLAGAGWYLYRNYTNRVAQTATTIPRRAQESA